MNKTNRRLQLEKIEQVEKKLKARKQKIINGMKSEQRKADTRRKILIGSIIIKDASNNATQQDNIKLKVSRLSERDQKVFESLFESWSDEQGA
ncbi:MAG: hypothetical protein R8K22_01985 [Mariprofundaceae bacterium]